MSPRAPQDGQSIIEFALALPLLLILLLGSWSVSQAAYQAQIVQETAFEGGKMAGIDRVRADNKDSFQMTDDEVLLWVNAAAHEADPSIGPSYPSGPAPIKFIGGRNKNGGFQFNGDASKLYSNGKPDSGVFGTLGSIASAGPLADLLNPNLKTAELEFDYQPGFSTGGSIPIRYSFDYTTFAMVWVPFGKASP